MANNVLGFIATIDVTDLKAGLTQVKEAISKTKSQFDASTAGLTSWQKTTEGVSAKLTQLNGQLKAQEKAVESYKNEIARVASLEGDHSKSLEILQAKLQKAETALTKTKTQVDKYSKSLETLKKKEEEENSANAKLLKSLEQNKSKLKDLESQYKSAVIQKGRFSTEAKNIASEIKKTNVELKKNEKQVKDLDSAYKFLSFDSSSFAKLGKTLIKSVAGIGAAITGAVVALDKYTEAGAEYNQAQKTIEINFSKSAISINSAKKAYSELFSVLGNTEKTTSTLSYLSKFATSEKQLTTLTNILTGAYVEFNGKLTTDELAKNISELTQTGEVTGQLNDLLKQTGVDLESFKNEIANCKDEEERLNLITKTLNSSVGDSAKKWKQENSVIVSQNQILEEQLKSKAEINEKIVELKNNIQEFATQALAQMIPYIKEALDYLKDNWKRLATIGGVIAGIGTALIAVNGAIKAYEIAVTAAKVAQIAWNAAMSANPIGIVLAGVAALGVGIKKTYDWYKKTNEEIEKSNTEAAAHMYDNVGFSLEYIVDKQSKAILVQRALTDEFGNTKYTIENLFKDGEFNIPEGWGLEEWLESNVDVIQRAEPEIQEKIKSVFDFEKALKTLQAENTIKTKLDKINQTYADSLKSWNNEYLLEKSRLEKENNAEGLADLEKTNQARINEISESAKEEAEALRSSYVASLDTYEEANEEIIHKLQVTIDEASSKIKETTEDVSLSWTQQVEQSMSKVSQEMSKWGNKISSVFSQITSTLNDYWQVEIDNLDNEYDKYVENLEAKQTAFEEQQQAEIDAVTNKYEKIAELDKEARETELDDNEQKYLDGLIDDKEYFLNKYKIEEKYNTKTEKDEKAKDKAIEASNLATTNYAKQLEEEKLAKEKEILAQKNELGEKQFKAQKANDIAQVWIKAALAIVTAYAESFWLGVAASVALPILAGVQTAAIAKQQYTPITALAEGGVIKQPTYALVGEAGEEAVLPLENNTDWIAKLADKLNTLMQKDFDISNYGITPEGAVYYNGDTNNYYNYNQTLNSPTQLTRAEIYKDSKNLLSLKKY